jgi:twitching motility protein PilT
MSLISEVLSYIGKLRIFSEVFLVPGAPPRVRELDLLKDILPVKLSPADTRNFLIYLRELAGKFGGLDKRGVFTVARPDFGRVRVVYGMQRGSYYLSLLKIPAEIPPVDTFLGDLAKFEKFFKVVENAQEMVFVVFGEDWFVNATFVFEIFKQLTLGDTKVIFTIENPPAYLLQHGTSVVVQKELYVDNKDLSEAVEDIPLVNPDYVYVFDVLNIYTLPFEELLRYITGRVNLFMNFPMRSKTLLKRFLSQNVDMGREYLLVRVYRTPKGLYDFTLENFGMH